MSKRKSEINKRKHADPLIYVNIAMLIIAIFWIATVIRDSIIK